MKENSAKQSPFYIKVARRVARTFLPSSFDDGLVGALHFLGALVLMIVGVCGRAGAQEIASPGAATESVSENVRVAEIGGGSSSEGVANAARGAALGAGFGPSLEDMASESPLSPMKAIPDIVTAPNLVEYNLAGQIMKFVDATVGHRIEFTYDPDGHLMRILKRSDGDVRTTVNVLRKEAVVEGKKTEDVQFKEIYKNVVMVEGEKKTGDLAGGDVAEIAQWVDDEGWHRIYGEKASYHEEAVKAKEETETVTVGDEEISAEELLMLRKLLKEFRILAEGLEGSEEIPDTALPNQS